MPRPSLGALCCPRAHGSAEEPHGATGVLTLKTRSWQRRAAACFPIAQEGGELRRGAGGGCGHPRRGHWPTPPHTRHTLPPSIHTPPWAARTGQAGRLLALPSLYQSRPTAVRLTPRARTRRGVGAETMGTEGHSKQPLTGGTLHHAVSKWPRKRSACIWFRRQTEARGLLSLPARPRARQPWPHPPLKCVPQSSATTLGQAGLCRDRSRGAPWPMLTSSTGVYSD